MTSLVDTADVVVWGGGTGAAAASSQSARCGASTLLLTPGAWLGGMVSAAGVCCPDGNELTPWQTGLWGAFLRELDHREVDGLDHNWVSCFGYRPSTAEAILQDWVRAEPNLIWWSGCRLLGVERDGGVVNAVRVEVDGEQRRVGCRVVIDGSDRGDLLPLAEAPYRFGWEARELWNEPSAPGRTRLESEQFFQDQPVQSPTWVVMGQLLGDRLPRDEGVALDSTVRPQLTSPFQRACEAFGLEKTITYGRLPGGLVMINWPLHGNDWHRELLRGFDNGGQQEAELFADMQSHSLRFAKALSDASDGWLDLGHAFPVQSGSPTPWLAAMPYWREGRRMVGRSTVIEQHLLPESDGASMAPLPRDETGQLQSIAVGNYANDHHYPGEDWPLAPKSCRWGGRWTGTPFTIPYGALISSDIDNLLTADKAFSTSHMANGATRLQPLILNIGQAAGAAAGLSVSSGMHPSELPVRLLQQQLISDPIAPSAVVPLWDTPWHHSQWRDRQTSALEQRELTRATYQTSASGDEVSGDEVSGVIHPDHHGGFHFEARNGERSPLITLEPAVNALLQELTGPTSVTLRAEHNPWGPWRRVTAVL